MEALLLATLQLLRVANKELYQGKKQGECLLKLNARRDAVLVALPNDAPETAADRARWELVLYVNRIAQQKIARQI